MGDAKGYSPCRPSIENVEPHKTDYGAFSRKANR